MKVLLDACVLYPPLLREFLLALMRADLFTGLWSARILEEWARAAARRGPEDEAAARRAIAALITEFPAAFVPAGGAGAEGDIEAELAAASRRYDRADLHVMASAQAGGADVLLTYNISDFPRAAMDRLGFTLRHPDSFLWELWSGAPHAVEKSLAEAEAAVPNIEAGRNGRLRRLHLPRLAKALRG